MFTPKNGQQEESSRQLAKHDSFATKNKPAFQFLDNRREAVAQRKYQAMANDHTASTGLQLRAVKFVTPHARTHYYDGWGAAYGIRSDNVLKARVPNGVTGSGSINLGDYDAPRAEQTTRGWIKSKNCSIGYEDSRYGDQTRIFACGPLGPASWRPIR